MEKPTFLTKPPQEKYYILDDRGEVKIVNNLLEWVTWIENAGPKRRIAYDEVGPLFISTVFLGLDYNFHSGTKPILFETMVFQKKITKKKDPLSQRIFAFNKEVEGPKRYSTKEKALEWHGRILRRLKKKYENNEEHEDSSRKNQIP